MTRYYPLLTRATYALLLTLPLGAAALAQAPAPESQSAPPSTFAKAPADEQGVERERASLSYDINAQALEDLPSSDNLYQLLETMQGDLISDRMDTGGIGMGQPAKIGAHGSSWTQTFFRVGDLNVTDPSGSGTPLFMPGVMEWDHVNISTGLPPIDVNAPGLAISLTPKRPSATWVRSVSGFFAPPGLISKRELTIPAGTTPATAWIVDPPPIERMNGWQDGSVFLSGPLSDKTGIVFAGTLGQSSHFERYDPTVLDANIQSAFSHIVMKRNPTDELRIVASGQRTSYAYPHRIALQQPESTQRDASGIGLATYERRHTNGSSWRAFGSWQARNTHVHLDPTSSIVMERLTEGPVNELLTPGNGTDQRAEIGLKMFPLPFERFGMRHHAEAGGSLSYGRASTDPGFTGTIGELINGVPARAWQYTGTGETSKWRSMNFSAYAGDRLQPLSKVVVDLGLRFEHQGGSAADAARGIWWNDLFPRASLRWDMLRFMGLSAFVGYGRYGYALPLRWLAYGDPHAPAAEIFRWTGATSKTQVNPADIGDMVMVAGPGTGGDPSFVAIDPALKRPHSDEVTFGLESRPSPRTVMRLTATARRDRGMVGLVDTAVPASAYDVGYRVDQGYQDVTQVLPGFNRLPATYATDRYLLTNPLEQGIDPSDETTLVGVDISGQTHTDHFYFMLGATADRSEGLSGNRGFTPNENDYGIIGDLFADPNSRTYAQGRDFTERGYTLKTSAAYEFPKDMHFGMIARYQDGLHFTRNVIFDDLNQGPEAVRAFRNGRTRFTFVMTVDMRLRKGFTIGKQRVEAVFDAYNLFNQQIQVEEYDVSSDLWRRTTAVQPPRVIHVGAKLTF